MDNYILSELLLIIGFIISLCAQLYITTSYNKYKKIENSKNLSGFEVARRILDRNKLKDIYITEVKGNLTDHYDPSRKVVRLSSEVFHGTTIASVSVAAHEVGHAIQDNTGYKFMRFRSSIYPIVNLSSYGGYFAILLGIIFQAIDLIWIGIALEVIVLLFQLVTLPVEFNASKRAKEELKKIQLINQDELEDVSAMLYAAALTYVASVITTILQILRLIVLYGGRRRD
ncbi:MAG: zinc metallopeptidase [bacterium]|nr:zinc metallopeptidase [bacterium]